MTAAPSIVKSTRALGKSGKRGPGRAVSTAPPRADGGPDQLNFGLGKTGLTLANSFGQTRSMSVREACSSAARAP